MALSAAFAVGVLNAVQSRLNGGLSLVVGSPAVAGLISFGTGLLILSVIVAVFPPARRGVIRGFRAVRERRLRPWQLLGGLCGGTFVMIQSGVVSVAGVAVFTVAVVGGHSGSALVVDRLGWGPRGVLPITPRRLAGAALAVAAVVVAAWASFQGATVAPASVALAAGAGCLVALQQAANGHVTVAAKSAVAATWLNFLVGFALVAVAVLAVRCLGAAPVPGLPTGQWWLYVGGMVGVVFIFLAAWAVPHVGVLATALLAVAGQLAAATAIDLVSPTASVPVSLGLVSAVVISGAAAVIGASGRRPQP